MKMYFLCLYQIVTFFYAEQLNLQRLVEGYLLRAAQRSDIFAHILIWHLQVRKMLSKFSHGYFFRSVTSCNDALACYVTDAVFLQGETCVPESVRDPTSVKVLLF